MRRMGKPDKVQGLGGALLELRLALGGSKNALDGQVDVAFASQPRQ